MKKTEMPAEPLESAVFNLWSASMVFRHGPQMIANDLENYTGDPDFEETERALRTRFYWRRSMAARRGPADDRENAYFELFGLTDVWEFPKLAALARQAFSTAPMPIDVSLYFAE